jgi:hypothetical protein
MRMAIDEQYLPYFNPVSEMARSSLAPKRSSISMSSISISPVAIARNPSWHENAFIIYITEDVRRVTPFFHVSGFFILLDMDAL